MKHLALLVIVGCAPLLVASPAAAGKQEQAMALYAKGEAHYENKEFTEALQAFQKAYKLEPAPLLFVNIAQCHRQLGNHTEAIGALERYLTAEPEAENRAEIEELLASERAALAGPAPEPTPEPPAPEPAVAEAPPPAPPPAPLPAATEDDSLFAQPVVWAAIGGTALVVVAGGALAAVLVTQPAPPQPVGTLGTFDLR